MTQIKARLRETASLTYRLYPLDAPAGSATARGETAREQPVAPHPRDRSPMIFAPSCPFHWSAPTSQPTDELAEATSSGDTAPASQGPSTSWLTRLRSRYVAWCERRRDARAWEGLETPRPRDTDTLPDRETDALSDEVNHDVRLAAIWGWYPFL
jgi:hypothetical protein